MHVSKLSEQFDYINGSCFLPHFQKKGIFSGILNLWRLTCITNVTTGSLLKALNVGNTTTIFNGNKGLKEPTFILYPRQLDCRADRITGHVHTHAHTNNYNVPSLFLSGSCRPFLGRKIVK